MNRATNLFTRGIYAMIIGFILLSGVALTFPAATQLVQTQLRALFGMDQK